MERLREGTIAALAALFILLGTGATSAQAATPLGAVPAVDPDGSFAGSVNMVQWTVGGAPSYMVPPGGGVITSWRHRGDAVTPGVGRLQLWQSTTPPNDFVMIGRSALEAFTSGVVNNFPTRIPVTGGELLGLRTDVATGGATFSTMLAADVVEYQGGEPDTAPGEATNLASSNPSERVNVAATLEPDADADGFGDETQDACPTSGSTQAPCADVSPPETTITQRPRDRTTQKFVTFGFASSELNSDFECSFDGQAFRPCASPEDELVGKGMHRFEVRARDRAGNVDPSPAGATWKNQKKKKKKKKKGKPRSR